MSEFIERWMSMEEITGHLGVSRESVIQWIAKKNMPAHKLGKLWKFKISEVDEWIESGDASKRAKSSRYESNKNEK